jgi:GxxExxY protein
MEAKHKDITELVIQAFYTVYNTLGYGFLEKVYQNALVIELRKLGLEVIPEACIKVYYNGQVVGEYFADLLVAGVVIVEIKAVRTLAPEHEAQLLNYLKATPYEVGLLLNFGPKPQIKRKVYDNERKGGLSWIGKWDTDAHRLAQIKNGSLGFRRERPHIVAPRSGKSAIALKVEIKALEQSCDPEDAVTAPLNRFDLVVQAFHETAAETVGKVVDYFV